MTNPKRFTRAALGLTVLTLAASLAAPASAAVEDPLDDLIVEESAGSGTDTDESGDVDATDDSDVGDGEDDGGGVDDEDGQTGVAPDSAEDTGAMPDDVIGEIPSDSCGTADVVEPFHGPRCR